MIKLTIMAILALGGSVSMFGVARSQEGGPAASQPAASVSTSTPARPPACADQAWPYVAPDCIAAATGAPARPVRTIAMR